MKSKLLQAIQEGIKQSFMIDSEIEDEDFVKSKVSKSKDYISHEYETVDLGLSVKWCTYNLGANPGNSYESWYGDYYAWGETKTKPKYSWGSYKFYEGYDTILKYNNEIGIKYTDNILQLQPEDDVVTQKLGDIFRMPTHGELQELVTHTTQTWVFDYKNIQGLNGCLLTSTITGYEDKSIFIPAAGIYIESTCHNSGLRCKISSSSLDIDNPYGVYCLYIAPEITNPNNNNSRFCGITVRGVCEQ